MYEIYCKLRDERGLKDADVARETGITKSTFSDWKTGRSAPKDQLRCHVMSLLMLYSLFIPPVSNVLLQKILNSDAEVVG